MIFIPAYSDRLFSSLLPLFRQLCHESLSRTHTQFVPLYCVEGVPFLPAVVVVVYSTVRRAASSVSSLSSLSYANMATGYQMGLLLSLSIVLTCVPGVLCDDGYSIAGLVSSAGVSFILLAVVIAMIAAGLTWNNWYPQLQWAKGKVKMPRAYWKKREEAKRRLLHGSRSGLASLAAPSESGLPNGHGASRVRDTASWVQGWNNANTMDEGGYEEMALAMELGEEREEPEVRIETTVVDNEALDLGPYYSTYAVTTSASTSAAAASTSAANASVSAAVSATEADASVGFEPSVRMEMTEEEPGEAYIYSVVDRSAKKAAAARSGAEAEEAAPDADVEGPAATSEKVTSFSKLDPDLMAL